MLFFFVSTLTTFPFTSLSAAIAKQANNISAAIAATALRNIAVLLLVNCPG
jgi:hypothetical protein